MRFSYLEEFVTLSETCEYLAAAHALHISQATLSKHIKSMEAELGVPLFYRTTRVVELSDCGRAFLPYAKKLLAEQKSFFSALQRQQASLSRTITVGLTPDLPLFLMRRIADLKAETDAFVVQMEEGDFATLRKRLRNGGLDLVLAQEPTAAAEDTLCTKTIKKTALAAILPQQHPLASRQALTLSDLADQSLLFLSSTTASYASAMEAFSMLHQKPEVVYCGTRSEAVFSLIQKGLGISIVPRWPHSNYARYQLVELPLEPALYEYTNMLYRPDNLSPALSAFLEALAVDALQRDTPLPAQPARA